MKVGGKKERRVTRPGRKMERGNKVSNKILDRKSRMKRKRVLEKKDNTRQEDDENGMG